jgi:protein CpxP
MKVKIAVLTSALLIGAAYAQSPGVSPSTPSMRVATTSSAQKSDAGRAAAVEKHIKEMHATLKITAAEESQWAGVAQTMRGNALELDKAIDKREAIVGSATAVENLNAYGEIAQAHVDSVKKLAAAFAPLYASMSDDQKKVADEVFAQRGHAEKKVAK